MRNDAIRYATLGWHVFRLKARDKWPLAPKCSRGGHESCDRSCGELGHGLYDAVNDVNTIARWWDEKPGANIGLRCGEVSGVFVLDVDLKAPKSSKVGAVCIDGPTAIAQMELQHGPLPVTLESRTGSGGRQLFFRYPTHRKVGSPKNLKLATGEITGVDVRGDGGIAVLPPSVHPDGPLYAWINDVEPVDAPDWLLDWIAPIRAARPAYVAPVRTGPTPRAEQKYADKVLSGAAEIVGNAQEKQRHDLILSQARLMGGYLAGGIPLAEEEVVETLINAGLQAYGGRDERVTATVRDGIEFGKAAPLPWPPEGARFAVPREVPPPPPVDEGYYAALEAGDADDSPPPPIPMRAPMPEVVGTVEGSAAVKVAPKRNKKPEIQIKRQKEEVLADAWSALHRYNGRECLYFTRAGLVAKLIRSEQGTVVEPCKPPDLGHALVHAADWMSLRKATPMDGNARNGMVEIDCDPPKDLPDLMLSRPAPWLPVIGQVVYAPTFAPSGRLVDEPGYDAETMRWYEDSGRPIQPVRLSSLEAVATLRDWLADFPFADDASFAHAIGMFLQPFVRDLIRGPTPLHVFGAPSPGTGKSLLCKIIASVSVGQDIPTATFPDKEDEVEKRIASMLYSGVSTIIFDNVDSHLKSPSLAQALTESTFTGRYLGQSKMITVPVRVTWALTANGMTAKRDLVRRTAMIRLVRVTPFDEATAVHPDIHGFTTENRDRLVSAAIKLVYDWIAAGSPSGKARLPSYESWAKVIGGILDVAGIPGFLQNREFEQLADPDSVEWERFIRAWSDRYRDEVVSAKDLCELAISLDVLGFYTSGESPAGRWSKFGRQLSKRHEAVIAGLQIRRRHTSIDGYQVVVPKGRR